MDCHTQEKDMKSSPGITDHERAVQNPQRLEVKSVDINVPKNLGFLGSKAAAERPRIY